MIEDNKIQYLKIEDIIPNRFQPRERFDEDSLEDLADSIKEHGVIQPIVVRKLGDKYELIAGERRTKASSLAGLTTIPAIVRNMNDKESAKVSLLENLQRKNLTAIEEAKTYKRILELDNMTQEELARTMGRSQPMVANKLRLLSLPEEIQEALVKNQISERHARSLLTIKNKKDQLLFLDRIKKERLTVRDLDKEIKKYKETNESKDELEEIKDKERIMNNNRSNFGGMGLNDYQSGVGNNMFNNIPNNFNNMATPIGNENQMDNYDYGEINNNSFDNQSIPSTGNNGMNIGNNNSLGSMFDGGMGQTNNNLSSNNIDNGNNNIFVSQIREDNLPKKENQFIPNFDDDVNSNSQSNFSMNNSMNNFTDDNNSNFMSSMNYNQPMNNSGNFNDMNQSMNYDMPMNNNMGSMNQNNYNMNNGMDYSQPMNNKGVNDMNQPMNDFYQNPNYQPNVNPMNNLMPMENQMMNQGMMQGSNQSYTAPVNNDFAMNSFEDYNGYNVQKENRIPEFGNGGNYYQNPNSGNLFNQPLNIVGPYGPPQMPEPPMPPVQQPSPTPSYVPPVEQQVMSQQTSVIPEQPVEPPIEAKTNEAKTNEEKPQEQAISISKEEQKNEQPNKNEDIPSEEKKEEQSEIELPKEEINSSLPDIEVIDDKEIPLPTNESSEQEYIHLDDEITIHNASDAVLELKKTTDKIKQNHIDIDTEEVEFDDVYQITIKIKKEEN